MKRLLMIAYHLPPIQGSSGVHRTVQFAKHLPEFGWEPLIVTVQPQAYLKIGNDYFGGLPKHIVLKRAFALDSARHLALRNRYLGISAFPDRWISWWPHGVITCMHLVKKYRPSVIWSTYPVATAHLIAMTIKRLTGLPWLADFRDPMIQDGRSVPGVHQKIYQWVETKTIQHSSIGVFVTKSTTEHYARNYPWKSQGYWQMIQNGYDEDLFLACQDRYQQQREIAKGDSIKLVHSGILYSRGRNPSAFFKAIRSYLLKGGGPVEITLRAPGTEIDFHDWISSYGLQGVIKIKPPISYVDAIEEMMQADALLLLQGSEFNRQVPAKSYEYIRAGHPILALTDAQGETAQFLKKWDGVYMVDLNSADAIEKALFQMVRDIKSNKSPSRDLSTVAKLSRRAGASKLCNILDMLIKH